MSLGSMADSTALAVAVSESWRNRVLLVSTMARQLLQLVGRMSTRGSGATGAQFRIGADLVK